MQIKPTTVLKNDSFQLVRNGVKMLSSQVIQNGQVFLDDRRTIILGLSPGNPFYFNVDNLRRLFQFGIDNSDKVLLFLPDKISEHNYRAVCSKNPEKSARVKGNSLRNKCKEALQRTEPQATSLRYIDWAEEVETSEEYEKAFISVKNLYEMNNEFHTDIRESTEAALKCLKNGREKGGGERTESNSAEIVLHLEEGVKYLLKELAFLAALPSIEEECEEFVFVYHRPCPVLVKFFDGDYDGIPKHYLGFVVYE